MSTVPLLRRAWQNKDYAEAPGCHTPQRIKELLDLHRGDGLYDFGCGDGHMVDYLCKQGVHAVGLDMIKIHPDTDLCNLVNTDDMLNPRRRFADNGICLGVMDHIPEEEVPGTILRIAHLVRTQIYFTIPIRDLGYNDLIGKKVQQTIKPIGWWRNRLSEIGAVKVEQPGDWMTAHVKCH